MLVFIDESGDCGLKLDSGSSPLFVVALVVFEDNEEAEACDRKIGLLKRELGWKQKDEFHFKKNSHNVRRAFINAVMAYNFFYYSIVLDKAKLYGERFKDKKSFYKYACSLVFESAKEKLYQASVTIDETGSLDFKKQLNKYLKIKMNTDLNRRIKHVKMQKSGSTNLLQLADYIAGIVNRSIQNRKNNALEYRTMIAHREILVQIWPTL